MTPDERQAARKKFLDQIVETLKADERFVAAWQTGSLARHAGGDAYSDMDIAVIVDTRFADSICSRPWMVAGKTTEERLAIFKLFGQPAIIHENHNNAPDGGTFTSVTYADNAFTVDWVFIAHERAHRPSPETSPLLFDKTDKGFRYYHKGKSKEERAQEASEKVAFFWMMTTVTIKYMLRQDIAYFHTLLHKLHQTLLEVINLVERYQWYEKEHISGSLVNLAPTLREQTAAVRDVARQMDELMPKVAEIGGYVPDNPMAIIETLLAITPVEEVPVVTAFEDNKVKVKRLIQNVEANVDWRVKIFIQHKHESIWQEINRLNTYFWGINTAMNGLLSPRNRGREYQRDVLKKRGWNSTDIHIVSDEMERKGMDDEAILREMIAIQIDTWKRIYDID